MMRVLSSLMKAPTEKAEQSFRRLACAQTAGPTRRHTRQMAYDEELADRLREALQDVPGVTEKRMFGGLAFMVSGNMTVTAGSQGGLMVRVDPSLSEELARRPHASRMVMRGKPMSGWVTVDADGLRTDPELTGWVETALSYARSLPPK